MHFSHLSSETVVSDRFKILSKLGQGANSCVYKALDLKTSTFVSLKMLDPFLIQDPVALERFGRECEILRTMNHPRIVKVFDLVFSESHKMMVMEYFEGQDLKSFIKEQVDPEISRVVSIFTKILSTLEDCHSKNVVHRDLKPQNILINKNDEIKLVDFGVSKVSGMSDLTKTGTLIGTPEYMAPEMFLKSILDFRTDIYSLGCVLFEMLNGVAPFVSTQISQLLSQKLNPDSIFGLERLPKTPEWLHRVVLKCLRVDPILRYQNCKELLSDIQAQEKAMACLEVKKEKAHCMKCKSEMLPGFAFCYQCGAFQSSLFSQGDWALVIHECGDTERLGQFLGGIFKEVGPATFKKCLSKLPFFLLQGVEAETAQNLANEIVYFRAKVQVTKALQSELKLPKLMVSFGIFAAFLIFLIPGISILPRVLLLLGIEGLLYFVFKFYTRPLLSKKAFLERESKIPKEIREFVKKVALLKTATTKAILGKLTFKALKTQGSSSEIFQKALALAELIDTYESQLSGQSLIQIKTNLVRLEAKAKTSQTLEDTENLIQAKSGLNTYYELQDAYSNTRLELLNLLAQS